MEIMTSFGVESFAVGLCCRHADVNLDLKGTEVISVSMNISTLH